jgi:fluoride exporter
MNIWLAVFIGGGLGSMARFGITRLMLMMGLRSAFPFATLASNIIASALLAWLIFRIQPELEGRDAVRAFLAVGFCGGFSTFSTFSYENYLLYREGLYMYVMANIVLSIIACLLFFHLAARST